MKLNDNIDFISNEYDTNYDPTGQLEIIFKDRHKMIVNDERLKEMVQISLENIDNNFLEEINLYYTQYESFRNFIDKHFPSIKERKESDSYVKS